MCVRAQWSVEFRLRPIAMAMSVVGIHALGDACSPIVIGKLQVGRPVLRRASHHTDPFSPRGVCVCVADRAQDELKNWDDTLLLASSWLAVSCVLFPLALWFARQRARSGQASALASRGAGVN
jgi:hypothetical protein